MCLDQGHNPVTLMRLEPPAHQSRVKHSTTEPLRSNKICPLVQKITYRKEAMRTPMPTEYAHQPHFGWGDINSADNILDVS